MCMVLWHLIFALFLTLGAVSFADLMDSVLFAFLASLVIVFQVYFFNLFKKIFLLLYYNSCPSFSPFALFRPTPTLLPQSIPTLLSRGYSHMFFGYSLPLLSTIISFPHLVAVSLFHISMPVVLVCLLVYLVHKIPVIGEISWYLSFTH